MRTLSALFGASALALAACTPGGDPDMIPSGGPAGALLRRPRFTHEEGLHDRGRQGREEDSRRS